MSDPWLDIIIFYTPHLLWTVCKRSKIQQLCDQMQSSMHQILTQTHLTVSTGLSYLKSSSEFSQARLKQCFSTFQSFFILLPPQFFFIRPPTLFWRAKRYTRFQQILNSLSIRYFSFLFWLYLCFFYSAQYVRSYGSEKGSVFGFTWKLCYILLLVDFLTINSNKMITFNWKFLLNIYRISEQLF